MKSSQILLQSLLFIAIIGFSVNLQTKAPTTANAPIKGKNTEQSKQIKKQAISKISSKAALNRIKKDFQHFTAKYHLKLKPEEENSLFTTTKHMIYVKAGNEDPSTPITLGDVDNIKRALEKRLKMFNPESFAAQTQNENYQISPRNITNPSDVNSFITSITPLIDTTLNESNTPSGKTVSSIKKKKQQRINAPNEIKLSRSKMARRSQPSRPYRSHKDVERRIPLAQAEKMVKNLLTKKSLNKQDAAFLLSKIMTLIKHQTTGRGLISPSRVKWIIDEEVTKFKTLQKEIAPSKKKRSQGSRQFVHYTLDDFA